MDNNNNNVSTMLIIILKITTSYIAMIRKTYLVMQQIINCIKIR